MLWTRGLNRVGFFRVGSGFFGFGSGSGRVGFTSWKFRVFSGFFRVFGFFAVNHSPTELSALRVLFRIRMPKSPNGIICSHIFEAKIVVGCESHFSALKRVLNFQSTRLTPRKTNEKLIAAQLLGLDWISSIFINRIIWLILIELQFVVLVNSIFNRFSNRSNQVFSFRVFSGFRVGFFRVRVRVGSGCDFEPDWDL